MPGKEYIGDDYSLTYPSFFADVPPAWNLIRAPRAALNPVQAVVPYGWLPCNKAVTRALAPTAR